MVPLNNRLWLCIGLIALLWHHPLVSSEIEFFIIIPSYNNNRVDRKGRNWIKRNLHSLFVQTYKKWTLRYINDCSTDGTGKVAEKYARRQGMKSKCQFVHNSINKGGLRNIYNSIRSCNPRKVVVLLDGDDALAHKHVLERVAREYHKKGAWITYGSYVCIPSKKRGMICKPIPSKVKKQNLIRSYTFVTSHLRTFYAKLFQNIQKSDLMYNGKFYGGGWDLAILFPMLEMASKGHIRFIKDILYHYNSVNPISDHNIHSDQQRETNISVRARMPYQPLDHLFSHKNKPVKKSS